MTATDTISRLRNLREKIFARRPVLGDIITHSGSMSLYEYAARYYDTPGNSFLPKRQTEFISTFRQEVEKRLGTNTAESAAQQLSTHYALSTTDHQGPLCHPFFLSSNLTTAATLAGTHDSSLRHVIVLACANISFNNSSYPRGLLVTSNGTPTKTPIPLPFFPDSARAYSVINYPNYAEKDMQAVLTKVDRMVTSHHLTAQQARQVKSLIAEVYMTPDVLGCHTYSDQVTKTNAALWERFFSPRPDNFPSIIYLESEMLITRLLVQHHMNTDTVIHRMLFDSAYQESLLKKFDNIMGGFTLDGKLGTYLFWALPSDKKYRQQLWKEGNTLTTPDGQYRVNMTPEDISQAMMKGELIPSTLLVFIVLSCYYGLKLFGGFNQVNYLTQTKSAYLSLMEEFNDQDSADYCRHTITDTFCGDFITVFIKTGDGSLVPATGLDLILHGTPETWQILVDASRSITLEEALAPMMPELYRIIYQENEQDPALGNLTKDEITRALSLDKKINACVSL